jgi:hypothetical protein
MTRTAAIASSADGASGSAAIRTALPRWRCTIRAKLVHGTNSMT